MAEGIFVVGNIGREGAEETSVEGGLDEWERSFN